MLVALEQIDLTTMLRLVAVQLSQHVRELELLLERQVLQHFGLWLVVPAQMRR